MGKRPEDIKKQKEKELEKKRKALEKSRAEAKKNDPAYMEKIKQEKAEAKRIKREAACGRIGVVTEKIISNKLFLPVTAALCFAVICGICYMNGDRIFSSDFSIQALFHCLYVGDFSIGVSSRLLIGSFLSLFSDTITADLIDAFARVFLYISFILQSVFTAFVIRKGIAQKNSFMLLLSAVFMVCPVTVCAYTLYFGVLDLYNYIIFIIAMIILVKGKSSLQFLIPVLSVIGLLIHYSYFFAFFPALFVIGLYRIVNSEGKQLKKEAAALGINSTVSVGGFFYLTLFAKNFLMMNSGEMLEYVHSKVNDSVRIFDDYLMYYIYDIFKGTQMSDTSSSLSALININNELRKPNASVQYLMFISLLLILFWVICAVLTKREKGKGKLPFIAACVMPLALVPELILSSDTWRWIASTVFCLFYVLFAFYIMKVPSLEKLFSDMKKMRLSGKIAITVILAIYIVLCFVFEHRIYT